MTTVAHLRLPAGSKTCFKTFVSALCRKGTCGRFCLAFVLPEEASISDCALPRMQSFRTDKLMLISRVSRIRSAPCTATSRAASDPAKSTRYRKPSESVFEFLTRMRHIPCERDELSFLNVGAERLKVAARSIRSIISFLSRIKCSFAPASCVTPKESSRIDIGLRELKRS